MKQAKKLLLLIPFICLGWGLNVYATGEANKTNAKTSSAIPIVVDKLKKS